MMSGNDHDEVPLDESNQSPEAVGGESSGSTELKQDQVESDEAVQKECNSHTVANGQSADGTKDCEAGSCCAASDCATPTDSTTCDIPQSSQTDDSIIKASDNCVDTAGVVPDITEREMVEFKVVYNKQSFNVTIPIDSTVLALKEHVQELTDVEVGNQKIMFKGLMKDDVTLRDHKLTNGSKVMVIGSKTTDIQLVNQTAGKSSKDVDRLGAAATKEPMCKQKPHKTVLEKYGKPDDAMPGIKNRKDVLPPAPLSGMYNKVGSKVRLTFKLENDQVWIGTKERTEKVGLSSIKAIVSEPIEGHEEYHLMALQLGPTEASRYWIYWVPAQYVDAIKDAVLGNWQYW